MGILEEKREEIAKLEERIADLKDLLSKCEEVLVPEKKGQER